MKHFLFCSLCLFLSSANGFEILSADGPYFDYASSDHYATIYTYEVKVENEAEVKGDAIDKKLLSTELLKKFLIDNTEFKYKLLMLDRNDACFQIGDCISLTETLDAKNLVVDTEEFLEDAVQFAPEEGTQLLDGNIMNRVYLYPFYRYNKETRSNQRALEKRLYIDVTKTYIKEEAKNKSFTIQVEVILYEALD